jgi:plasmid stabilization system protein ParE
MACKLIWSPISRDDLRHIVRFIARDNPARAESFGYELMRRTDILQEQPEAGRIVYRVAIEQELVEIARVWHAARGTPSV